MSRVIYQKRFMGLTLASLATIVAWGMFGQGTAFSQTEDQQNALRAQALTEHNNFRAMYVNDPALVLPTSSTPPSDVYTVLNTGSAKWATYLASSGNWAHSSAEDRTIASSGDVAGENLASFYTSVNLGPADLAKMAVASWYSEVSNFSYLKPLDTSVGQTGHFTQVIWVGTTTVGCGYGVQPDPMNPGYNTYIVACRYDPPGNVQDLGAYQANVPMLKMGNK